MPATKSQLTVRIPTDLRQRVKRRAVADGVSVQAFVERTLRAAVGPELRLSDADADALDEFIRNGGYQKIVDEIAREDPDLATM